MKTIKRLQEEIYRNAVDKGFYDPPRSYGESIALMHSELSEALEEARKNPEGLAKVYYTVAGREVDKVGDRFYIDADRGGNIDMGSNGKPEGFAVELADCVIRILDTCEYLGIDLQQIIEEKMAYNATREHKHGGKHI